MKPSSFLGKLKFKSFRDDKNKILSPARDWLILVIFFFCLLLAAVGGLTIFYWKLERVGQKEMVSDVSAVKLDENKLNQIIGEYKNKMDARLNFETWGKDLADPAR